MVMSWLADCKDAKHHQTKCDGEDDDSDGEVSKVSEHLVCDHEQVIESGVQVILGKLMKSMKALMPTVPCRRLPSDRQTVIFLDWDDTLLCTTFLAARGELQMTREIGLQLLIMSKHVERLIQQAIKLGMLYIVTNAEDGWVQASAEMWMPQLLPLLANVTVMSARSRFEQDYPDDAFMWKKKAFLQVKRDLREEAFTNLISVGDSWYEMAAVRALGEEFERKLVKTVKFQAQPSPRILNEQLYFLTQELEYIERRPTSVDICL